MISPRLGFGPAVGDVLGDAAEEQERLLEHQADVPTIRLDREPAEVDTVDQDRPFAHVVEPAGQVDQRALAGAAGADQADHLARLDRQVDPLEDPTVPVAEADVLEDDLALDVAGVDRPGGLGDGRDPVEDLPDPLGAGGGPLGRLDHPAQRFEPGVEPDDVRLEPEQDARGDLTLKNQPGPERPDDQQAPLREQADHRPEERPGRVDPVVDLEVSVVRGAEPLDLAPALGERLDHPDARDRVGQDAGDLGPGPSL